MKSMWIKREFFFMRCRNALNFLISTLERHIELTGSERASKLLQKLPNSLSKVWVVIPASEKGNALVAEEVS